MRYYKELLQKKLYREPRKSLEKDVFRQVALLKSKESSVSFNFKTALVLTSLLMFAVLNINSLSQDGFHPEMVAQEELLEHLELLTEYEGDLTELSDEDWELLLEDDETV